MKTLENDPLDFARIAQVLNKRKWLILACLAVIVIPVLIINQALPTVYKADTKLIFEEQQGVAASSAPMRISLSRSYIRNQIEQIESRSLAEEVIQCLPKNVLNTIPLPKKQAAEFNKDEYLTRWVQERVNAKSIPYSEVIAIEFEAYSPIAAATIVNTVAQVFQKRNLDIKLEETSTVRSIIEEQLVQFKQQLDEAEIELKNYREKNAVTSVDQEAEEIFRRITEAEIIYNQAKANLESARKRLTFVTEKLESERRELVPSITDITTPWVQRLKEQLVELEVQYTTLQVQDYSEDHPKMKKLKDQIAQVKSSLKQESIKIAAGENIVDPISKIQRYLDEVLDLEIEIQTYQARENTLKAVIGEYNSALNALPEKEIRLAQLLRDKEVNEKIYMMLLEKREESKIAEAEKVGNIRIIDSARIPNQPVKPKKAMNLLFGTILGLLLGLGATFIIENQDRSVKTIAAIKRTINLNILGAIPVVRSKARLGLAKGSRQNSDNGLVTLHSPSGPESEAFRALRTNVLNRMTLPSKIVLITSPNPGDGKTFITANLGIASAQMGLKTVLVEADLRRPSLSKLFEIKMTPGLVNILASIYEMPEGSEFKSIRDNDREVAVYLKSDSMQSMLAQTIRDTRVPNLAVLPCGDIPENPSELLSLKGMEEILQELQEQYDLIFVDTPPINIVTDASILGAYVNASMMVIKIGNAQAEEIQNAKDLLLNSRAKIIGVVVNQVSGTDGNSKRTYYSTNKHQRYAEKATERSAV